jgi:hypothetical protein
MFKRLLVLSIVVSVVSMAGHASADLILHWGFDEGSGTIAHDSSGNGHDGTVVGDPAWVAGKIGGALDLDGSGDHVVDEAAGDYLNGLEAITICVWIKSDVVGTDKGFIILEDPNGGDNRNMRYDAASWAWEGGTNLIKTALDSTGGHQAYEGSDNTQTTEWQNVAMVWSSGNELLLYIDGELDTPRGTDAGTEGTVSGVTKLIVGKGCKDADGGWDGLVDDVRIYNEALSADAIQIAMVGEGYPYAIGPDPADGALHEDTWVTLSWKPGDFAASHDVYLGDNSDDVSNATRDSDLFRGDQTTAFYVAGFPGFAYPEGLAPGTTYYWRIDEVNETHPESPWKGPVWSFSIPPKTAYHPDPIDGAESIDLEPTLSWTPGYGAKLHTMYFGDSYDEVETATEGFPSGSASYSPGPLEREKVYYWRVDEFDGTVTSKGDVWTFATLGAVGNPQPAHSATDVAMGTILTWTAADNAESHQVYLGLDKDTVRGADTSAPEYKGTVFLGVESYDPGLLELKTMYYWRVDEVYDGNPVKGPIWSFTVGDHILVDDFESYTDDDAAGQAIWQNWTDGFGVADNGAQVGYLVPPYCERTIIHGGSQSMPLLYANETGVTNSEAALTLTAPRDWTQAGVVQLSLWFRGSATNATEPLYVALANSSGVPAVVAHSAGVAAVRSWTQWRIPLQAFRDQGINLSNVDKVAIGLGSKSGIASSGGSGTVYIDDVRLYRP